MSALNYKQCTLCPRECKADRTKTVGFCGMGDIITAAKAMIHTAEEPCISGTRGSGAIFFSGCVLRCAFCQNYQISHDRIGKEIDSHRLGEIMLELQEKRVHNINLVSATQFYPSVIESIDEIKDRIHIPIVWNTGGYERKDAVDKLGDYVDIYLQDMKYYSTVLSKNYSKAADYFEHAISAVELMVVQKGAPSFDSQGMLEHGVIIRHLVLPSCRKDSIRILEEIKRRIGTEHVILSLMSQYTPPAFDTGYKELSRRITDFEYKSVCEKALELGFEGYFQERESASSFYTPSFDMSGV